MQIRKIMRKSVIWCDASITAQEAAALMKKHGVGTLPVIEDVDSRKVVGMVTDRDLCIKVVAAGIDPRFASVRECMNTDVMTCHTTIDATEALEFMRRGRVRRLPVTNRFGGLIGIVSIDDIARARAAKTEEISDALAVIGTPLDQERPKVA